MSISTPWISLFEKSSGSSSGSNRNIIFITITLLSWFVSLGNHPVEGVSNNNNNNNNFGVPAAKAWDGNDYPGNYYPQEEEEENSSSNNNNNNNNIASMYSPNRPPGSAASNPIDYDFQQKMPKSEKPDMDDNNPMMSKQAERESNNNNDDEDEVELPQTTLEDDMENIYGRYDDGRRDDGGEGMTATMSARRDALSMYRKSGGFSGKMKLTMASTLVGGMLGMFIDKSLFGENVMIMTYLGIVTFFVCSTILHNNDYGEWISTLGLTIIFLLRRIRFIRRQYPTRPYIMALIFRRNHNNDPNDDKNLPLQFPPNTDNPWQYQPTSEDDPEFNMVRSIIAMALVGSTCGGSLPLLPTWMGGMIGAASFAYITTVSQGHLARIMAMRVVSLLEEALDIQRQLNLTNKTKVVFFKLLDKCLILDRKHRIKEKIIAFFTFLYNNIMKIQSDMASSSNNNNDQPPPRNNRNPNNYRDNRTDDSRFRGQRPPPPQQYRGRDDNGARFQDRRPRRPPENDDYYPMSGRRDDDKYPPRPNDFDRRRPDNDRPGYDNNNYNNRGPPQNRNDKFQKEDNATKR